MPWVPARRDRYGIRLQRYLNGAVELYSECILIWIYKWLTHCAEVEFDSRRSMRESTRGNWSPRHFSTLSHNGDFIPEIFAADNIYPPRLAVKSATGKARKINFHYRNVHAPRMEMLAKVARDKKCIEETFPMLRVFYELQ